MLLHVVYISNETSNIYVSFKLLIHVITYKSESSILIFYGVRVNRYRSITRIKTNDQVDIYKYILRSCSQLNT